MRPELTLEAFTEGGERETPGGDRSTWKEVRMAKKEAPAFLFSLLPTSLLGLF